MQKELVDKVFTTSPGAKWLKRQLWFKSFIRLCSVWSGNNWSYLRFVGAPVVILSIIWLDSVWLPALIFLGFALTDLVDGEVARLRQEASQQGAFLDALADKFFILPIMVFLYIHFINNYNLTIDWWLPLIYVIAIDSFGRWILKKYWSYEKIVPNYKSNIWGKWKFAFQCFTASFLFLAYYISWIWFSSIILTLLIITLILSVMSFLRHMFYCKIVKG